MWNIIFLVSGLLFLLLAIYIYFSKQTIKSKENSIFRAILFANVFEYIVEIPLQIFTRTLSVDDILVDIFSKVYLVSIFVIFSIFTSYTFYITLKGDNEIKNKKFSLFSKILIGYTVINSIVLLCLPILKYYDATKMYAYGAGVDYLKLLSGIYLIFWITTIFINIKSINSKI